MPDNKWENMRNIAQRDLEALKKAEESWTIERVQQTCIAKSMITSHQSRSRFISVFDMKETKCKKEEVQDRRQFRGGGLHWELCWCPDPILLRELLFELGVFLAKVRNDLKKLFQDGISPPRATFRMPRSARPTIAGFAWFCKDKPD